MLAARSRQILLHPAAAAATTVAAAACAAVELAQGRQQRGGCQELRCQVSGIDPIFGSLELAVPPELLQAAGCRPNRCFRLRRLAGQGGTALGVSTERPAASWQQQVRWVGYPILAPPGSCVPRPRPAPPVIARSQTLASASVRSAAPWQPPQGGPSLLGACCCIASGAART